MARAVRSDVKAVAETLPALGDTPLDPAAPPSRSAAVARTAIRAAEILTEADPRCRVPTRAERDALLVGFAKRRRVIYGAAYDVVRLDREVDLIDPDDIAANIDAITLYEVTGTNQAKIGDDLKGYFFNITSAELLVAQSLGNRFRLAFVNTVTKRWQEMAVSEVLGRAKAIYPAFHIRF